MSWLMPFQWYDLFMNSIQYPIGLWKEIFFHFECRDYPVAGSDNHGRRIKVIKCKLRDCLCQFLKE